MAEKHCGKRPVDTDKMEYANYYQLDHLFWGTKSISAEALYRATVTSAKCAGMLAVLRQ